MNLAELWATVPTKTDADLKQLACSFPTQETADLLLGQDAITTNGPFRIAVTPMADGTFFLGADVLREMHPDVTDTNLYGPDFAPLMEQLGPTVAIKTMTDALAALPRPVTGEFDRETGEVLEVPPDWIQPDSTNPYSVGSLVSHNGKTFRSVVNFNVWSPDPFPLGFGWVEFPAPPPPTGPLAWVQPQPGVPGREPYQIGDVVYHPDEATLWESLHISNVWEPSAALPTLWKPDAVWTPPDVSIKPWQQPVSGVHPPYEVNDQVTHVGRLWTCNFSQNAWEPGATSSYGWFDEGPI